MVKLTSNGPLNGELSFTPHFRNNSDQKFGELSNDWSDAVRVLLPDQGWSAGQVTNESDYINNVNFYRNENGQSVIDNSLKPSWAELEKVFNEQIATGFGGEILLGQIDTLTVPAEASLTVNPVNDAPIVSNMALTIDEDGSCLLYTSPSPRDNR